MSEYEPHASEPTPAWRAVLGLMKPSSETEPGVHPSMVASYRLRTVAVAAIICAAAIVVVLVYVALSRRNTLLDPQFSLLLALGIVVLGGLVLTPWNRVLATSRALPALYGWCTLGLLVLCLAVYIDGGGTSALNMVLPVLTTFFAVAFAPRAQLLLLMVTVAGYSTALALRGWNTTAADYWVWISAVVLMAYVASVLSAWLVAEMRNRQMSTSAADQRAGMLGTVARSARRVTSLDVTQVLGGALSGAMELGCHEAEVWDVAGEPDVFTLQRRLAAELTSPNEDIARSLFAQVRLSGEASIEGQDVGAPVLGCPIVREGVVRGVFVVRASDRDLQDALFVECIQLLATQVGAGLDVLHSVAQRRGLEERLAHWAFHDSLTDLPNRVLFADRLEQALARIARDGTCVAVLFLDLDDFKMVNDTLGHGAGDQLLQAVSERLQRCLRPNDTLARYGGDEFVILVETVEDPAAAVLVAQRVLDELREPVTLGDHRLGVKTSIGIALTGAKPGADADVLRRADIAMYEAKAQGGSCYVLSVTPPNSPAPTPSST